LQSGYPIVSSCLLHEPTQAYYYGLDPILMLLSITYTTPATAMGMGHWIGMLKAG
ncbi:uncharacterized protein F5891DRAFT_891223, partial [Suillus fuscotomentosus]